MMKIQKKEGSFYAAKVRLFLNEYGGIDLEEFCKAERVSYTKMCHCLGRPSYRKPKDNPNDKSVSVVKDISTSVLPELDLKPLVIDMPVKPDSHSPAFSKVLIRFGSRFEINLGQCDIRQIVCLMKEMEVQLC